MTTNVSEAFLEAFGTQESLTSPEIKNIISIIHGIVAAHPDPDSFYDHKPEEMLEALKTELRRTLSSERNFQVLIVLFGSMLNDEWLAILARTIGDTLAECEDTVRWWFCSINDNCTLAMARALCLFAMHIREHRLEEFQREFTAFLLRPGKLGRLVIAASVLDDSDKVLVEPLKGLLLKIGGYDAPDGKFAKRRDEIVAALGAVIRKIEGKPQQKKQQKKWWKFWPRD